MIIQNNNPLNGFVGFGTSNSSNSVDTYDNSNVSLAVTNDIGGRGEIALAYSANQYSTSATANDVVFRNTATVGKIHLQGGGNNSAAMTISSNSMIGISTSIPQYTLDVADSSKTSNFDCDSGGFGANTSTND